MMNAQSATLPAEGQQLLEEALGQGQAAVDLLDTLLSAAVGTLPDADPIPVNDALRARINAVGDLLYRALQPLADLVAEVVGQAAPSSSHRAAALRLIVDNARGVRPE